MRSHQTEQGIAQIYSLMTSLRAEGVPRKLALITLAWAQLLAGTHYDRPPSYCSHEMDTLYPRVSALHRRQDGS